MVYETSISYRVPGRKDKVGKARSVDIYIRNQNLSQKCLTNFLHLITSPKANGLDNLYILADHMVTSESSYL